jgi:hypothetical protein
MDVSLVSLRRIKADDRQQRGRLPVPSVSVAWDSEGRWVQSECTRPSSLIAELYRVTDFFIVLNVSWHSARDADGCSHAQQSHLS